MNQNELEEALQATFADSKLSTNEKYALRELFKDLDSDPQSLNFVRNRAFELVGEQLRSEGADTQAALKWLEQVIRTLDSTREQPPPFTSSAYFSPGDACRNRIISKIKNAKNSIDVCVFTISDDRISSALLAAHQGGIGVRVITDDDKSQDMGSDIEEFIAQGIPVKMDDSPSHMHHKFALFDQCCLLNGSFNWTRSASKSNRENIVLSSDSTLVKAFARIFDELWRSSTSPTAR